MHLSVVKKPDREIKGIIFDLDGTLLNSREARVRAWSEAFKRNGTSVPDSVLRPLIGLPGEALAAPYSDDPAGIERDEEEIFASSLEQIEFFPDVDQTVKHLKEKGISVSIVTSSRRKLLDRLNLPIDTVICIDDVSRGKPDPESYLLAAERMSVDPVHILVVGDSENDLIPCIETGSVCVLFRDGRNIESERAHFYIDSISEILVLVGRINSQNAGKS